MQTSITISGRSYYAHPDFDVEGLCASLEDLARDGGCITIATTDGEAIIGIPPGTAVFVERHSAQAHVVVPQQHLAVYEV